MARAQVRVSAHQAESRINVFPRPLSPKRKFMRGLNWTSSFGAGPTPLNFSDSSIGLSLYLTVGRGATHVQAWGGALRKHQAFPPGGFCRPHFASRLLARA